MALDGPVRAMWILAVLVVTCSVHSLVRPAEKLGIKRFIDGSYYAASSKFKSNNISVSLPELSERGSSDSRQERDYLNSDFIYPDVTRRSAAENCIHGLCTGVDGYPKEKIKQLLRRSDLTKYFAPMELPNRFKEPDDDKLETFCETIEHSIFPEKAKNIKAQEKTIVNVDGHQQGIVFKTCMNGGACKYSSLFPSGRVSYCKQEYVVRRLMVLGDDEKLVFDSFEIPSCCICKLKKV